MKEIEFLINDVREQTDNEDTNGVKDREFVRYFNDGVKTIQAMIFKNNPLCSYYQGSTIFSSINNSRIYDLPADVYADNAVSLVEIKRDGCWTPLDRQWPEEGNAFLGWYTRNKQLIITGHEDYRLDGQLRVWYFKRLPRFDKAWATVDSKAGQVLTVTVLDEEMFKIDRFICVLSPDGAVRVSGLSYKKTTPTTLTVVGDVTAIQNGDIIVMGKSSLLTVDLPDECEPYLMDYVAQRVAGRNQYGEDWNKLNYWTSEERSNIISIFADASQAEMRAPITDTEYLRI